MAFYFSYKYMKIDVKFNNLSQQFYKFLEKRNGLENLKNLLSIFTHAHCLVELMLWLTI